MTIYFIHFFILKVCLCEIEVKTVHFFAQSFFSKIKNQASLSSSSIQFEHFELIFVPKKKQFLLYSVKRDKYVKLGLLLSTPPHFKPFKVGEQGLKKFDEKWIETGGGGGAGYVDR